VLREGKGWAFLEEYEAERTAFLEIKDYGVLQFFLTTV
jgi:hypothetical protein